MTALTTPEQNRLLDLSAVDDSVYLALVSTTPTAGGVGTELVGSGYARQVISMAAASGGVKTNDTQILFPAATGDWSNIVGWEVWDAPTNGNRRWFLALDAESQRLIKIGDQYRVPVGNISFSLNT